MTDMPKDSFDGLLKAALSSAGADAGEVHPDAEVLAGWFERTLDANTMGVVDIHLSSCARCQAYAATLARVSEAAAAPEAPAASLWQRWGFRWLVPVGAVAVLALWMVWPAGRPTPAGVPERIEARLEEQAQAAPPTSPPGGRQPGRDADNGQPARTERAREAEPPGAAKRAATDDTPVAPPAAVAAAPVAAMPPSAARPMAANEVQARLGEAASQISAARSAEMAPGAAAKREADAVAPAQAALIRWRIVAGRTVERTSPDGTWFQVELPVAGTLRALSSPGGAVCWVVGADGFVLVTVDGARFARVPFPQRGDVVGVRATDGVTATVTMADGRRFVTADQGATWAAPPR